MLAEKWRMWYQGCMWTSNCVVTKVTILPCTGVSKMPPEVLSARLGLFKMTISGIVDLRNLNVSFHLLHLFLSLSLSLTFSISVFWSVFVVTLNSPGWVIFYSVLSSRKFSCYSWLFWLPMKAWMLDTLLTSWRACSMKWPNSSANFPWNVVHMLTP